MRKHSKNVDVLRPAALRKTQPRTAPLPMLAALVPPPSLGLYDGYSAAYFPGGPATVPRSAEPIVTIANCSASPGR